MKKRITIRLDEDVLDWFKGCGGSYQARINGVLRNYMDCGGMTTHSCAQNSDIVPNTGFGPEVKNVNTEDPFFNPMSKEKQLGKKK